MREEGRGRAGKEDNSLEGEEGVKEEKGIHMDVPKWKGYSKEGGREGATICT